MKRCFWLLWLWAGVLAGAAFAQEALVEQVERSLQAKDGKAVHDLGRLLKPGGIRELEQLATEFRADGMGVHFVTVPRNSTNVGALAETVYRDLKYTASDLLIVFDGRQVYGKTLALQGEPRAFQQAAKEAQAGFRLYYAKGLSQFAQLLRERIAQRRAATGVAAPVAVTPARGHGLLRGLLVLVIGLMLAGIAYAGVKRASVRPGYQERLQAAEEVYRRVTLAMPDPAPEEINQTWLRMDEQLQRCRDARRGSLAALVDLTADLNDFDRRLAERGKRSASESKEG